MSTKDGPAEIPLDVQICAIIVALILPIMFVCICIGAYQKWTKAPEKDWRDGYREWQEIMKTTRGPNENR